MAGREFVDPAFHAPSLAGRQVGFSLRDRLPLAAGFVAFIATPA